MPQYDEFSPLDSRQTSAGDTYFSGFNTRLRPDQLQPGVLAYSQNGRMDVDGAWQPRKGIDYFGGGVDASSSAAIIPFYLYASIDILLADRVGETVTVTTDGAHGFTTSTQVGIQGLTGTVDPNGNWTITVTDTDEFTFDITGAGGSETYGGSGTAGAPLILDTSVNSAFGSCSFSDPSADNAAYIVQAFNESAVATKLSDATETTITYPTGITISSNVTMLQAFDKVYIFRDGATALEWDGDLGGGLAFTKVANGSFTQPTVFTTASNAAISQGLVTISETAHGLAVGDVVTIMDGGGTGLVVGDSYVVITAPANSFTFRASLDDNATASVVLGVAQTLGSGFTHMPAPPWAAYHQRRLIAPYFYTTTGASGSETITDREIRDELVISDILDGDTYDVLQNQLKVTAGIADYLKWVHPFAEDNAIVFNRNSIHLLSGLSGSLSDVVLREITREAGLVARNSVVTIGNRVFFLSDNGVYATEFGDLYNLRGAGLPLSDAIDPLIKRINSSYASESVGVFHNNRYYLAVPLDGATSNNAILVFNVLNNAWESVDLINSEKWNISNLIAIGIGSVNKLYAVNKFGGIHIVDERVDDVDNVALGAGVGTQTQAVSSLLTSRQYTMGTIDRKRFQSFELHVESTSTNTSDGVISVETENADKSATLGNLSTFLGETLALDEDASVRGRIGNMRSYGLQLSFTPSQGRPKIRAIRINGTSEGTSINQAT